MRVPQVGFNVTCRSTCKEESECVRNVCVCVYFIDREAVLSVFYPRSDRVCLEAC